MRVNRAIALLGRTLLGAGWAYNGIWSKLLARDPRHQRIVTGLPMVGPRRARVVCAAIGLAETLLAARMLIARPTVGTAAFQSIAVAAMNLGGLRWAPAEIPSPRRLFATSTAFVALAWCVALHKSGDR